MGQPRHPRSRQWLGALAQTLRQRKPKRMRVRFEGSPAKGVGAKDLVLHLIGRLGTDSGVGYAIEYAGSAVAR
jgi:3-isopropylmalate/(R)-2-methylmalate dehydratase large subunit